jgi:hypothetical protein
MIGFSDLITQKKQADAQYHLGKKHPLFSFGLS